MQAQALSSRRMRMHVEPVHAQAQASKGAGNSESLGKPNYSCMGIAYIGVVLLAPLIVRGYIGSVHIGPL